jgi:hypothetical protein
MFDVSFPISEEDFNKDAFFKSMGVENESEYVDEDGDLLLSISFADREDTPKQHAHIRISIYSNKVGAVSINYYHTGIKVPDKKPPYLEDCAQWFGGFVKRDEIPAVVNVAYDFEEGFTTTLPLPFPLVASHEALTGLKVTGLSFQYPDGAPIETAIVQREEKKVFLFFHKKAVIKLKEFDLFKELEALTPTVDTLVKRLEKTNGSKKKTKARKTS